MIKNVFLTDPGLPIPQSEERDENTGKWCIRFFVALQMEKKKILDTFSFVFKIICFLEYGHGGVHSS